MGPALAVVLLAVTGGYGPIDWKVGDHMEYEIDATPIGKVGTMTNDVTQDTGPAVWLKQQTVITGSPDVQEMLVQKTDGKILQYIKNGQQATYADNGMQIASEDQESVTVLAGTFSSTHIVASTTDVSHIEIWSNTTSTPIDGMLKTVIGQGFGDTIQLTAYSRAH